MGRPPKPHHLKVIEGNPGKRRLTEPPKPPPAKPRMPSDLPAYAKTVWRRIVPILDELGLLTPLDTENLVAYCVAAARVKEARKMIAATAILVTGQKGEPVVNPAFRVERDNLRLMSTYSAMFGFSPSDRVRLTGHAGSSSNLPTVDQVLGL